VCSQTCREYVEKQRVSEFGVGRCDHQTPYIPVIWDQVPHYFPHLLKDMTPEQALPVCKKMCADRIPSLSLECEDKCITDFYAVERSSDDKVVTHEKFDGGMGGVGGVGLGVMSRMNVMGGGDENSANTEEVLGNKKKNTTAIVIISLMAVVLLI